MDKQTFIETIAFIYEERTRQDRFCDVLEFLSPGEYCNCFLYNRYEERLINMLVEIMDDKESDLIRYKMYEFDTWNIYDKEEQLKETPYLENWETLYDFLQLKKGGK